MILRRILTCCGRLPRAKSGEQCIRLQNGPLYPRVEVEQRFHSGDEIGCKFDRIFVSIEDLKTFPRD